MDKHYPVDGGADEKLAYIAAQISQATLPPQAQLKAGEECRAAYYEMSLKTGLVRCESHSTSGRSSRGQK